MISLRKTTIPAAANVLPFFARYVASISHFHSRWIIDELSLTKILHGHLLPLFHGAYKLCLLPIYRRHYPFGSQRDAKWAIRDSVNYWMQNRWWRRWRLLSLAPIKSFINGGNFFWRKPWEKYLNICFCEEVMLFSRLVFASFLMRQMGTGRCLYCFPHFARKLKKYAASLFLL